MVVMDSVDSAAAAHRAWYDHASAVNPVSATANASDVDLADAYFKNQNAYFASAQNAYSMPGKKRNSIRQKKEKKTIM